MIIPITKLYTEYSGELILDEEIVKNIEKEWNEIIKNNVNNYYNGNMYCATKFDVSIPLISFSKTKFASLMYAKRTNKIIINSLFSSSYIKTSDNYIGVVLNSNNRLNTIGGMASDEDIIDNKFDYNKCLIREFKEELGIDLNNNDMFDIKLKYLKYPNRNENGSIGTLFEIKTNYTSNELQEIFNNSEHDTEVKQLMFYNQDNLDELYNYDNKIVYLDELFKLIFG